MNTKARFLVFGFLIFAFTSGFADSIPTAKDIGNLVKEADQTAKTFMQESFGLRMSHEYDGGFLDPNDKQNLRNLAEEAGLRLQTIIDNQKALKQQIEDYTGQDWDKLYGTTNLWRRFSTDMYRANMNKCEIDFYLALSADKPQRNTIARDVLSRLDSLQQIHYATYVQFLNARTLALLAHTDSRYKLLAKKEFDQLGIRSDMLHTTVFKIGVERIKLLGETEAGQLDKLAGELSRSDCADDPEVVLPLVFLARNLKGHQAFEKTVNLFPQTKGVLGSVILFNLSSRVRQHLSTEQTSVFEAKLAAYTAWKDNTKKHPLVLNYLAQKNRFQTPLILYATAAATADSSLKKALTLLIKASRLQKTQRCDMLDIDATDLAQQAAIMAYKMLNKNLLDCDSAVTAFENYRKIARRMDEGPEYLYSVILTRCGKAAESTRLLQKIAGRNRGTFRHKAKLDLIVQQMQKSNLENQEEREQILEQLSSLIDVCGKRTQTRTDAVIIYCELLLEKEDLASARQVLKILSTERVMLKPALVLFQSKALRLTGKLNKAAADLAKYIVIGKESYCGEVAQLLTQAIDDIDRLQTENNDSQFHSLIENLHKLAEFSRRCTESQASEILTAEVAIFAAKKDPEKLTQVQTTLENLTQKGDDNVDLIRCRARLLMEQDKFEKSAELWAQICKTRKNETSAPNQRSRKWWRAKFYELSCWSRIPGTQKAKVLHTIEVLESSFADIPPLWAQKLKAIKERYL